MDAGNTGTVSKEDLLQLGQGRRKSKGAKFIETRNEKLVALIGSQATHIGREEFTRRYYETLKPLRRPDFDSALVHFLSVARECVRRQFVELSEGRAKDQIEANKWKETAMTERAGRAELQALLDGRGVTSPGRHEELKLLRQKVLGLEGDLSEARAARAELEASLAVEVAKKKHAASPKALASIRSALESQLSPGSRPDPRDAALEHAHTEHAAMEVALRESTVEVAGLNSRLAEAERRLEAAEKAREEAEGRLREHEHEAAEELRALRRSVAPLRESNAKLQALKPKRPNPTRWSEVDDSRAFLLLISPGGARRSAPRPQNAIPGRRDRT